MAVEPHWFSRVSRVESSRLAWAFVISMCLHAAAGGGYYAGKKFGWWQNGHWPAWLQSAKVLATVLRKKEDRSQHFGRLQPGRPMAVLPPAEFFTRVIAAARRRVQAHGNHERPGQSRRLDPAHS